ncbi:MAG TPA: PKD domain-containing protein, partial [Bacteroidia bacterium]
MKKVFIFICFSFSIVLQAQNVSPKSSDGCLTLSKSLYNWQEIEAEFIKQLKITPEQSKSFFRYAAKWKYLKMEDYFRLVKEGAITAANAQQYWIDKLPYFEDLYKFKYLSAIESEKKQATLTNLRNGSNSVNQTMSSCNNLDFSAGNLSNWTGKWNNQGSSLDTTISGNQYGYGFPNVTGLNSSGGVNSMGWVHELCTAGTDPLVPISRIPPGHTYSLRLGNDSAYINASQGGTGPSLPFNHQIISNTFSVTPASQTITYWYAVVLDQSTISPHPQSEQPFFKIRMYNAATGTEITCAKYDVDCTQASTIGGFDSLNDVTGNYKFFYKNWTQVLIPLTSYIGQNVTITFETSDCLLGGHFGYAYLAVDCAPLTLIAALPQPCVGGNTTLTAPPGLATYSWTGPSIVGSNAGQVATVNTGGSYTVSMTTFANSGQVGCALVLSDTIANSTVSPIASFSATTPCLNINTQFTDLSTLLPNQGTITAWHWNFGDGGTSISHNPTHLYTT